MSHVVLLGDSIFDNAAYTRGGPDVIRQLRERLPSGWRGTLAAVDGAVVQSVLPQLSRLPADATHLVMSAGGNDALGRLDLMSRPARSSAEVLGMLAEAAESFEGRYRAVLARVLERGLPTAVCTIYDPRFPDPTEQRLAVTGLMIFNDVILRAAFSAGVPVIDLRLVCDRDADYATPIEPSSQGGAKIASAIVRLLAGHGFATRRTEVYV